MLWLHPWEEEDIANRLAVGKEHDKAVYPYPKAASRRHSLAESFNKIFIVRRCFFVAARTPLCLLFEQLALQLWVRQFAVGIAHLAAEDKAFKAFDQSLPVALWISVGAAEGGCLNGVIDDVMRLDQVVFDFCFKKMGYKKASCRSF